MNSIRHGQRGDMTAKTIMRYELPAGRELFVVGNHGVIKAMFGCRKCTIIDRGETIRVGRVKPGIFSPDQCLDWLLGEK